MARGLSSVNPEPKAKPKTNLRGGLLLAQVDQAMPRDVARGLSSVKRFVREHRIGGVHGTLIELFQCAPQLYTAVEVVPCLKQRAAPEHCNLYICCGQALGV